MSVTDRRLTLGVDRDALGTEYLPAHERRRELVFKNEGHRFEFVSNRDPVSPCAAA
jgi:hypothetical protein